MKLELPKRGRPAALTSEEELRREPKKAKLHANDVVPLDFFREALQNPTLFLEPTEPTTESGNKDENASSTATGDERSSTTKPAASATSESGKEESSPPTSGDEGSSASNALSAGSGNELTSTASVTGIKPAKRFGWYSEALLRDCYIDLFEEINQEITARNERVEGGVETGSKLIEVRGSAGIGKSVFLALLMAELKISGLQDFALFHAPKTTDEVSRGLDQVLCSLWIAGELKMDGKRYGQDATQAELEKHVPRLEAIFMDGCSMNFSLEDFSGVIYVAAPPSVSTKNLRKAHPNQHIVLYMPPWSLDEAVAAGHFLGAEQHVVEENYAHMKGIARYLFKKGSAKTKVVCAVKEVNPQAITNMVASNQTDKQTELAMVHSLVLWVPTKENGKYDYRKDVHFELVSRFAEKKVAEKLIKADLATLLEARRLLKPMIGAEGYSGALFEAYAIKKICEGGTFNITCLEEGTGQKTTNLTIPPMDDEPIVVECNVLTLSTVPLNSVHVKAGADSDSWLAKVLWPITSNFPTFDCFYFHTDGEVFPLQMTVAEKTHDLKNSGAYQTSKYLSKFDSCKTPYKAVFVCPKGTRPIKRQKFTGNVKDGKEILVGEKKAAETMGKVFEQWILRL